MPDKKGLSMSETKSRQEVEKDMVVRQSLKSSVGHQDCEVNGTNPQSFPTPTLFVYNKDRIPSLYDAASNSRPVYPLGK